MDEDTLSRALAAAVEHMPMEVAGGDRLGNPAKVTVTVSHDATVAFMKELQSDRSTDHADPTAK